MRAQTPWIYSPKFDLTFIIGPSVLITLFTLFFGARLNALEQMPLWTWVLLVLGIDVAHVYSSLFRTYFDRAEFAQRKTLYIVVPIVCWLGGVGLYFISAKTFWFVLAYAAIWHFVRQQYGFMMLYRRGEARQTWQFRIDQAAIYLATLYPLVYWHTYPRAFKWFEQSEMLTIPTPWVEYITRAIYITALVLFFIKEVMAWRATGKVNAGKCLLLMGTSASWFVGIIMFNGDLTFSMVNIVSHGIPYIALVWIYQYRKRDKPNHVPIKFLSFFQLKYIPIYLGVLAALAFLEEGIWDRLIWKEHSDLYGKMLASVTPGPIWLAILIPLLAMPQATHYVLDAFIWRLNKGVKNEQLTTSV